MEDDYFSIVSLQRTPLQAAAEAGRLEVPSMGLRWFNGGESGVMN